MTLWSKSHEEEEQEEGRSGWDSTKIEWKLSDVNTRAVSRGLIKLIGKFKKEWVM